MNYLKEIRKVVGEAGWKELFARSWNHLKRKIMAHGDWIFDVKYGVDTCG